MREINLVSMDNGLTSYPERYWHLEVILKNEEDRVLINQRFQEIWRDIVIPWQDDRRFTVSGLVVQKEDIKVIKLVQTSAPSLEAVEAAWCGYMDYHDDMKITPVKPINIDNPRELLMDYGKDYTNQLLPWEPARTKAVALNMVLSICKRLPESARILFHREQEEKPFKGRKIPYKIEDEYDVQDLLYAILKCYFKSVKKEDPIPKNAGLSGRLDLGIEELGVVIELKYVYENDRGSKFSKEFGKYLVTYFQKCPYLNTFIYVIYNSHKLKDREVLEELSQKYVIGGKEINVQVVLA